MTSPADLSYIIPLKWKPFVGFIGSLLTLAVPYVLTAEAFLPWYANLGIGLVLATLTALGIYRAPYVPDNAVLAPKTQAVVEAAGQPTDEHKNIWL